MSERQILINLCAGAGLADHMGDMAGDIWKALKLIGIDPPIEVGGLPELGEWLAMHYDAQTVWGTSLLDED